MYIGNKKIFPITSKGDSSFIRFSAYADGEDFTEERKEGQNYIGIATGQSAPSAKEGYTWCEFVAGISIPDGSITEEKMSWLELAGSGYAIPERMMPSSVLNDIEDLKNVDLSIYVKNTDYPTVNPRNAGVIKVDTYHGFNVGQEGSAGVLIPIWASNAEIDGKSDRRFINPKNLDYALAKSSLKEDISELQSSIGVKSITSSDFVNGMFSLGTGISESNYNIITNSGYPVSVGDKIVVEPNGLKATVMIESTSDLSDVQTHLKIVPNITEYFEYISEYEGYVFVQVTKIDGLHIKPEDYVCNVCVYRNKFEKIEERIDEVESDLKNDIAELAEIQSSIFAKSITSSDFVNGMFSLGTGISDSTYNIITNSGYPVSVGDKIKIVPNGYIVTLMIESVDDLSKVERHLLIKPNISEEFEILSEYDGYVFVQVYNNGQKITPAGFDGEIIIGENKIDAMDGRVGEIEKVMDNIPKTSLSASPRQKPFTRIINDCQTASDWRFTNTSTAISNVDTTNFIMGVQSLRTDKLMRCVKNTYDLLNNDIVLKIKINSLPSGARLQLKLANTSDSSTSAVYELDRGSAYYAPNDWIEYVIPYTAYKSIYGEGTVDFRKIDDVYLYASEGTVDFNLQYIGIRPKTLRNGIVTFTFDDGYKSQYTGIKTLAEKGITGTLFHIMEATTESSNGYLTVSELQDLVNHYGADIEVHGNPGYDQWDETELVEHWAKSQKWLKENGLGEGKYMAYPSGMYPDNVVQLAKAYFESCRTIKSFVPLESYPPADRYRIHAVSAISDNNIDSVKTYIDKAVEGGAWLTLVFHKIGEETGDSMDCSVEGLKAIADYAIDSGAYIMNYAEVFDSGILAK